MIMRFLRRAYRCALRRIVRRSVRAARADLLTDVSHELQTPIAILRGNVEVLRRPGATPAERSCAERVIVSTLDGMAALVAGVLEGARARYWDMEERTPAPQYMEMVPFLCDIREDCALLAEERAVRLSVGRSEAVAVRADPCRVREVILNLVSNALKHTPPGGAIVLSAHTAGAFAEVAVRDSGSGIAPDELPRIFERFYRIGGSRASVPGTGLGLHICREIVQGQGGTIRAESAPGEGSCFVVSLPLAADAGAPALGRTAPAAPSAIMNS